MTNTVPLAVLSCIDQIYGRMQDNYKFAYPNDNFDTTRGHQVFCRFSMFCNFIHTLLNKDNVDTDNAVESIYFQQVLANTNIISSDKEWAYPSNNLSASRSSTALNCIESSIRNYVSAIKVLGEHCFNNKTVDFNLINFIEKVSVSNAYNYAYPNNHYDEEKAHASFQMLLTISECTIISLSSIKTNQEELQNILTTSIEKVQFCKDVLSKAYPNNSFNKSVGHQCLTQFINSWKSFKEISLTSFKTHFEKQNIIKEYEAKLKEHNIVSQVAETPDMEKEAIEKPIEEIGTQSVDSLNMPVVKKIKSLL